MQKMHHLSLDGDILLTFVTIYKHRSIVKAAKTLNQNPSTLSHRLERLREVCRDPLFVRAGRGIVPTTRASKIYENAKVALNAMKTFVEDNVFDPSLLEGTIVIGLTDLDLSSFLIDLHKEVLKTAPNLRLDFVSNHYADITTALRRNEFDLMLSPNNTLNDADIRTRVLTKDTAVCYYDPHIRRAPNTLKRYLDSKHIRVMFSASDVNYTDISLNEVNLKRRSVVTVPSYSEVAGFMQGTDLITTLPARLSSSVMKAFAFCPPPFKMESYDYSLFWHESTNKSLEHAWLREKIIEISSRLPATM